MKYSIASSAFMLLFVSPFSSAKLFRGVEKRVEADRQKPEVPQPCTADKWVDVTINGCNFLAIKEKTEELLEEAGCDNEWDYELKLLMRANHARQALSKIKVLCMDLWDSVQHSKWTDIKAEFNPDFMEEYMEGLGYLNNETGNFRNANGTDPRKNDPYETTERSYQAGQAVKDFYETTAKNSKNSVLTEVESLADCEHQAMMCCFGRDRQFGDGANNGDCEEDDCDDANPQDNSNLCYVDDPEPFTEYPNDTEGQIHCHGIAWSRDKNDFTAKLRFNNIFYVSMYDHMYTRGYVGPTVDDVRMCGCVEDMNPVVRADCTEIVATLDVKVTYDENEGLSVQKSSNLEVTYQQCQGINGVPAEANDLAYYIRRLVHEGKMKIGTQNDIYETVVGFDDEQNQDNEAACEAAVERYKAYQDEDYDSSEFDWDNAY